MQVVSSLLSSSSAPAAGGGAGSGLLGGLQVGASLFAMLAKMGAGRAESSRLESEAAATDLQKNTATAQSMQRQTALKRELLRVLGQTDVAFAASGIDLTQGAAVNARDAAERRATSELGVERAGLDAELAQLDTRQRLLRRMARTARRASGLEVAGQGLATTIDMLERG